MHRLNFILALAFLLQACAGLPLPFSATATPESTSTATVTFTPTITQTPTITPTITPSATIVHIPTQDPNVTPTFISIPIFVGSVTATPPITSTPDRPGRGFASVQVSENKIFWGSCQPNKAEITVKVEDPKEVYLVYIFVQVKSATKEDYTPWTNGEWMQNHFDGTYTYVLKANHIQGRKDYLHSLVFFQLVATNKKGLEVGRSKIFRDLIALSPCM